MARCTGNLFVGGSLYMFIYIPTTLDLLQLAVMVIHSTQVPCGRKVLVIRHPGSSKSIRQCRFGIAVAAVVFL